MNLRGAVVIVTGGANGIGRALCRRFATENLGGLVIADIDEDAARETARSTGGVAVRCDVACRADVQRLVDDAVSRYGCIDLFCSNAGIMIPGGEEVPDEDWERIWRTNVMAHVHAARAVLRVMLSRDGGYFLATVSAAGLLNQIGSAPYGVTKHAAIAFMEWLAIEYGDRGVKVSCLCPQGVRTRMLEAGRSGGRPHFLDEGALLPEVVAEEALRGIQAENFLILPHPEVLDYFRRKASDYDRWLRGMRRLRQKVIA